MTQPTRRAAHRRRRDGRGRGGTALTGTGILVALWLGLTAPSVSPVAAPAPAMHSVAQSVDAPAAPDGTARPVAGP
ncbi:MAG: hypothetical protein QOE76_719 [Frankiales bacterium]|jgi:3-oxoacyl-(acyl-carrier-protein) synthase|nr:hypothetical protein [Frankiales bacterium]